MPETNFAGWLEMMWRCYNQIVARLDEMAQDLAALRQDVASLRRDTQHKKPDE